MISPTQRTLAHLRMSEHEKRMQLQIRACGLPAPAREHRFAPPRRWRFDFAWPDKLLALEVEGGTHTGGRHVRGTGYEKDCEKYNAAVIAGWRVLRVTSAMVRDGRALDALERALS